MVPVLPLDKVRPLHVLSAAAAVAACGWVGIFSKLTHPHALAVTGVWALYHGVCAATPLPTPGRNGDGNTPRHVLTAAMLAVLDPPNIGYNVAIGFAGAGAETIVGSKDEKVFLALQLIGSIYLAVVGAVANPWSAAGRIVLTLGTGVRNKIVRAIPGSGFTDPTRTTRLIMTEYAMMYLSTTTVLGAAILDVQATQSSYVFLGTASSFVAIVLGLAVDRAYNTSPATRAETIAMSLLTVEARH